MVQRQGVTARRPRRARGQPAAHPTTNRHGENAGREPADRQPHPSARGNSSDLTQYADGSISLRPPNNNHRHGRNAGASPLIANRTTIALEEFTSLTRGRSISLRAHATTTFHGRLRRGEPLIANRTAVRSMGGVDLISAERDRCECSSLNGPCHEKAVHWFGFPARSWWPRPASGHGSGGGGRGGHHGVQNVPSPWTRRTWCAARTRGSAGPTGTGESMALGNAGCVAAGRRRLHRRSSTGHTSRTGSPLGQLVIPGLSRMTARPTSPARSTSTRDADESWLTMTAFVRATPRSWWWT